MSDTGGPYGYETPLAGNSQANAIDFIVRQITAKVHTATLVKITEVASFGLDQIGHVHVQPLVHQVDPSGKKTTPHAVIYNVPFMRIQGGTNAIVMDPKVGDIGIAVFASRDISNVKKNKDAAAPGSFRRHSMGDGLYLGGFLNGTPQQYVMLMDEGIKIVSPHKITLQAESMDMNITGDIAITAASIKHGTKHIDNTHFHGDPQGGSTTPPTQ